MLLPPLTALPIASVRAVAGYPAVFDEPTNARCAQQVQWNVGSVGQSGMAGFDARLADSGRAAAKRDGGRIMCSVR